MIALPLEGILIRIPASKYMNLFDGVKFSLTFFPRPLLHCTHSVIYANLSAAFYEGGNGITSGASFSPVFYTRTGINWESTRNAWARNAEKILQYMEESPPSPE